LCCGFCGRVFCSKITSLKWNSPAGFADPNLRGRLTTISRVSIERLTGRRVDSGGVSGRSLEALSARGNRGRACGADPWGNPRSCSQYDCAVCSPGGGRTRLLAFFFALTGKLVAAPGVKTVAEVENSGADAVTGAASLWAKPRSAVLISSGGGECGGGECGGLEDGTKEGLLTRAR
jgi:hypothetical protein